MPPSKEFKTTAKIKAHESALAAARAALAGVLGDAERDKQVEHYNDLLDNAREIGHRAQTLGVPKSVVLTVTPPGKTAYTVVGWHVASVLGNFPGAGSGRGRMGLMLTEKGNLIGFRTTRHVDGIDPSSGALVPTQLFVTQEPDKMARGCTPGELGLAKQEADGAFGRLTHLAHAEAVTVASAYETLAGFAADNRLV